MVRNNVPDEGSHPLEYDKNFNGPIKGRSCTDILCLLLFLAFIGAWIGLGVFAIVNGDPKTLLVPKDSRGRRCGMDNGVEDKPYLFFFDLTKCLAPTTPFLGCNTWQMCVKECPSENKIDVHTGDTYCDPDQPSKCPGWYIKSTAVLNRCLYNIADRRQLKSDVSKGDEISVMKRKLYSYSYWFHLVSQNTIAVFTHDKHTQEVLEDVVDDIITSWWKILIGIGISVVICFIYIVLLRWIAKVMVWFSLIGVLVLLGLAVYYTSTSYVKYKDLADDGVNVDGGISSNKTRRDWWLAGTIISSIVLLIIFLMVVFLRNRIVLAIALIEEGSKAVSSVTSVLVFPIFPWILQFGIIAYAIVVGLYLTTIGDPIYKKSKENEDATCSGVGQTCLPNDTLSAGCVCKFISMQNPPAYLYCHAFNIFGFFWSAFFATAMGEMILASVFAQWYWTFKKSKLPFFAVTSATSRVLRYHIGTLAFGSLIIAICRMIRIALEYLDRKLKEYDNEFTKAILCCLKCFFWCLEKFLKFINKNAYIMCAIHGKNFCASAKDAFMLLMRNIVRVFVLDKVTDFLFFISKLLVTIGVGALAYIVFATNYTSIDNSDLKYGVVPVVIIALSTYLITSLFFNVYSMAVDTLFLCFLEDCERNDGSAEKPYFMSKNLMKILGKKNKQS